MNRWLWHCISTPFQSGMDFLDRLLINKCTVTNFLQILNLATANINTLRSREQCIPPSRDVFCVGLFRVNPSTAPKIRKLDPRPQLTHTHINAHEICSFGSCELIPLLSRVIKYLRLKNHDALNCKMWSLWYLMSDWCLWIAGSPLVWAGGTLRTSSIIRIFSGFMSRWNIPFRCMWSMAASHQPYFNNESMYILSN